MLETAHAAHAGKDRQGPRNRVAGDGVIRAPTGDLTPYIRSSARPQCLRRGDRLLVEGTAPEIGREPGLDFLANQGGDRPVITVADQLRILDVPDLPWDPVTRIARHRGDGDSLHPR